MPTRIRLSRLSSVIASFCLSLACCAFAAAGPPRGVGLAWAPDAALSDEFNTHHVNPRGDGIDDSKWWDDHPRWSGRLPSQFSAANSWVEDGMLQLRATSRVSSMSEVDDDRNDHWIDTAAVVSRTQATYGSYFEASIKTANTSLSSAFWFRMNSKSEIDVIENIGNPSFTNLAHRRSEMSYNTHFYNPPPDIAVGGKAQMVDDNGDPLLSAENFVTYAVWWKSPTEVLFYYNDIEVANVTPAGLFDEGLHMIFDIEAFHWVGFPSIADLNDATKNTMQVDWVRAYQAVELLPGDYDANGQINGEDYHVWRDEFGMTGAGLAADGNGDGVVNAADYTVWRDNLGATAPPLGAGSVVSTPEPAGLSLLCLSAGALLLGCGRRR